METAQECIKLYINVQNVVLITYEVANHWIAEVSLCIPQPDASSGWDIKVCGHTEVIENARRPSFQQSIKIPLEVARRSGARALVEVFQTADGERDISLLLGKADFDLSTLLSLRPDEVLRSALRNRRDTGLARAIAEAGTCVEVNAVIEDTYSVVSGSVSREIFSQPLQAASLRQNQSGSYQTSTSGQVAARDTTLGSGSLRSRVTGYESQYHTPYDSDDSTMSPFKKGTHGDISSSSSSPPSTTSSSSSSGVGRRSDVGKLAETLKLSDLSSPEGKKLAKQPVLDDPRFGGNSGGNSNSNIHTLPHATPSKDNPLAYPVDTSSMFVEAEQDAYRAKLEENQVRDAVRLKADLPTRNVPAPIAFTVDFDALTEGDEQEDVDHHYQGEMTGKNQGGHDDDDDGEMIDGSSRTGEDATVTRVTTSSSTTHPTTTTTTTTTTTHSTLPQSTPKTKGLPSHLQHLASKGGKTPRQRVSLPGSTVYDITGGSGGSGGRSGMLTNRSSSITPSKTRDLSHSRHGTSTATDGRKSDDMVDIASDVHVQRLSSLASPFPKPSSHPSSSFTPTTFAPPPSFVGAASQPGKIDDPSIVSTLSLILSSRSETDWKNRITALDRVSSLCSESPLLATDLLPCLQPLVEPMVCQLQDTRTQVLRHACHTLTVIAISLGEHFLPAFASSLAATLALCRSHKHTVAAFATQCLTDIARAVRTPQFVREIIKLSSSSQHVGSSSATVEALMVCVATWPGVCINDARDDLFEALSRHLLPHSAQHVRSLARRLFFSAWQRWPHIAQPVFLSQPPQIQSAIVKEYPAFILTPQHSTDSGNSSSNSNSNSNSVDGNKDVNIHGNLPTETEALLKASSVLNRSGTQPSSLPSSSPSSLPTHTTPSIRDVSDRVEKGKITRESKDHYNGEEEEEDEDEGSGGEEDDDYSHESVSDEDVSFTRQNRRKPTREEGEKKLSEKQARDEDRSRRSRSGREGERSGERVVDMNGGMVVVKEGKRGDRVVDVSVTATPGKRRGRGREEKKGKGGGGGGGDTRDSRGRRGRDQGWESDDVSSSYDDEDDSYDTDYDDADLSVNVSTTLITSDSQMPTTSNDINNSSNTNRADPQGTTRTTTTVTVQRARGRRRDSSPVSSRRRHHHRDESHQGLPSSSPPAPLPPPSHPHSQPHPRSSHPAPISSATHHPSSTSLSTATPSSTSIRPMSSQHMHTPAARPRSASTSRSATGVKKEPRVTSHPGAPATVGRATTTASRVSGSNVSDSSSGSGSSSNSARGVEKPPFAVLVPSTNESTEPSFLQHTVSSALHINASPSPSRPQSAGGRPTSASSTLTSGMGSGMGGSGSGVSGSKVRPTPLSSSSSKAMAERAAVLQAQATAARMTGVAVDLAGKVESMEASQHAQDYAGQVVATRLEEQHDALERAKERVRVQQAQLRAEQAAQKEREQAVRAGLDALEAERIRRLQQSQRVVNNLHGGVPVSEKGDYDRVMETESEERKGKALAVGKIATMKEYGVEIDSDVLGKRDMMANIPSTSSGGQGTITPIKQRENVASRSLPRSRSVSLLRGIGVGSGSSSVITRGGRGGGAGRQGVCGSECATVVNQAKDALAKARQENVRLQSEMAGLRAQLGTQALVAKDAQSQVGTAAAYTRRIEKLLQVNAELSSKLASFRTEMEESHRRKMQAIKADYEARLVETAHSRDDNMDNAVATSRTKLDAIMVEKRALIKRLQGCASRERALQQALDAREEELTRLRAALAESQASLHAAQVTTDKAVRELDDANAALADMRTNQQELLLLRQIHDLLPPRGSHGNSLESADRLSVPRRYLELTAAHAELRRSLNDALERLGQGETEVKRSREEKEEALALLHDARVRLRQVEHQYLSERAALTSREHKLRLQASQSVPLAFGQRVSSAPQPPESMLPPPTPGGGRDGGAAERGALVTSRLNANRPPSKNITPNKQPRTPSRSPHRGKIGGRSEEKGEGRKGGNEMAYNGRGALFGGSLGNTSSSLHLRSASNSNTRSDDLASSMADRDDDGGDGDGDDDAATPSKPRFLTNTVSWSNKAKETRKRPPPPPSPPTPPPPPSPPPPPPPAPRNVMDMSCQAFVDVLQALIDIDEYSDERYQQQLDTLNYVRDADDTEKGDVRGSSEWLGVERDLRQCKILWDKMKENEAEITKEKSAGNTKALVTLQVQAKNLERTFQTLKDALDSGWRSLLELQGQIDGSVIQALADALRDEDEDG